MSLQKIIEEINEDKVKYADIRREKSIETSLQIKDGEKEKAIGGEDEGAFVRVLFGNGWGAANTSNIENLKETAEKALSLAKKSDELKEEEVDFSRTDPLQESARIEGEKNFSDVSMEKKIELLEDLNKRLQKEYVKSAELGYSESTTEKEIVTSEGTHVQMEIPRLVVSMEVTGKRDTVQRAFERIGGTGGFELAEKSYEKTDQLLDRLKSLLEGSSPPSGRMPLIMDPHLTGVFVHEAFGHAAEGDLVVNGSSCLENKIGDQVASEDVTIVDDPTLDGLGRFPYDDEGTKTKKRTLVEDGKLKEFILDKESAWKLGMEPNGGARAENYKVKPIPRMSNTVMKGGNMSFDEMLEEVDIGVYAKSSRGGQVDSSQGTFQFNAEEAKLIKNGEIKEPLRDVSFNGFTLKTLKNVVGMTEEVDYSGVGSCGKGDQMVPVGSGGPHVLISEVTIGGNA